MKLVLASASPRRQELLQLISPRFTVFSPDVDETPPENCPAEKLPEILALKKATAGAEKFPGDFIIGADTIVLAEGAVLGKPLSPRHNEEMLVALSGKTHYVYTGVALVYRGAAHTFTQKSAVTFYPLGAEEIARYAASGEGADKAGGYGIQGVGSLLVKKVDGDYFSVVGFPVARLAREMNDFFGPDWQKKLD